MRIERNMHTEQTEQRSIARSASDINESSYYCNLYNLKIALDGIHRHTLDPISKECAIRLGLGR